MFLKLATVLYLLFVLLIEREHKSLLRRWPAEKATIEIVIPHFLECLFRCPAIMCDAVNGRKSPGSMSPTLTVHVHGPIGWIVD